MSLNLTRDQIQESYLISGKLFSWPVAQDWCLLWGFSVHILVSYIFSAFIYGFTDILGVYFGK